MKTLSHQDLTTSPQHYQDIADVLANDGIVCFPSGGSYRLATRLLSEKAVIQFMQVKRRTRKAPVLVFIPNRQALQNLVATVPSSAELLMQEFWPGPLTLKLSLDDSLPRKLVKNLDKSGIVGVRVPSGEIAQQILQAFGEPLLISSANIANKKGAHSEASIRKNFGRWIDIFVSAGDLSPQGCSTVVDATVNPIAVKRPGVIEEHQLAKAWSREADSETTTTSVTA